MIFCSSQSPFYCSPTCPLLVAATLLCPGLWGQGWSSYPFSFLLESRLGKNTHILPGWEEWSWSQGGGQALGWGRDRQLFPGLAVIRLQPLPI